MKPYTCSTPNTQSSTQTCCYSSLPLLCLPGNSTFPIEYFPNAASPTHHWASGRQRGDGTHNRRQARTTPKSPPMERIQKPKPRTPTYIINSRNDALLSFCFITVAESAGSQSARVNRGNRVSRPQTRATGQTTGLSSSRRLSGCFEGHTLLLRGFLTRLTA